MIHDFQNWTILRSQASAAQEESVTPNTWPTIDQSVTELGAERMRVALILASLALSAAPISGQDIEVLSHICKYGVHASGDR